jgi:hypothetical protein
VMRALHGRMMHREGIPREPAAYQGQQQESRELEFCQSQRISMLYGGYCPPIALTHCSV